MRTSKSKLTPAEAARQLLRWAGAKVPYDTGKIAAALGIEVEAIPLSDSLCGCLVQEEPDRYLIVVNSRLRPPRRRFSVAHELGHWVLHRRYRQYFACSYRTRSRFEHQANRFAVELLMPAEEVRRVAEKIAFTSQAAYFGVSLEAMDLRLRELGIYKTGMKGGKA